MSRSVIGASALGGAHVYGRSLTNRKRPRDGWHNGPLMRRYHLTTFGCQMNAHDSERIKGMLEELGLGEAAEPESADVLVFNTCTIREKPDTKFAAYLGQAIARKRARPEMVIAVGGCYAEAQRERLFELYPEVDVAFGPGSIPHLGEWLGAGGFGVTRSRFGLDDRTFAGELPMHRERAFQAWVQISMGCNSKCSYCIVPAVRGREVSRRPGDVIAEVTGLAQQGVRELTLLGQNVNSWGRDLLPDIHTEFGELLRACDAVDGIERIRFTSPHPKDFRAPVIAAIVDCAAVCEHIHLPLQSGSTRGQDRPDGAPGRSHAAHSAHAQRGAHRAGRGGARRRPVANRPLAASRSDAAQHDAQLHRRRRGRGAGARHRRGGDFDDAVGPSGAGRRARLSAEY